MYIFFGILNYWNPNFKFMDSVLIGQIFYLDIICFYVAHFQRFDPTLSKKVEFANVKRLPG